jgi:hypothetical protein
MKNVGEWMIRAATIIALIPGTISSILTVANFLH